MLVQPVRRSVLACTVCLLAGFSGCAGSSISTRPNTPVSFAAWASRTQRLCRQKQAAIARLGYVHITFGGIARVGLPAVRRSLVGYLGRLLAVLREFAHRQRQLRTPSSAVSSMRTAEEIDRQSQAATVHVQRAVANAATPRELSSDFRTWLTALQPLAARGDAVARRLNLPACRSGSGASAS